MTTTMASYVSRRFLSSSGRNAAKHIRIKKNEFEKLRTFSSKAAEASSKELISNNKPSPVEGGIRAGRHFRYMHTFVAGMLVGVTYHCYRVLK